MRGRIALLSVIAALIFSACASRAPAPVDECTACRAVTIPPPPSER
ncbi:hypothetical protein [Nitratifractor salsuginis]|uniref:Lipoprotein n=1 Tax=Nitratifractor salsuginis (strain DSM 16511 / JCM 12458 / E9I37-1) TaxID=749222 RepID=E6WXS8_NITSE|nr:hypothetical protein [Nitratifractor salsuginis]ADV46335.1 hypothetical protein Nitsa_1079 [Nitratifractor salsuginis DSM 16511]